MASIRSRQPKSPFYFACYTGPDGQRVQRSTKQSNRKKAQACADQWEKAAKLGSEGRLGESQARRVLAEIYEAVNGEKLKSATARDYLNEWSEKRKTDTSPRTAAAYGQVVRDFMASLGSRGERDISQLTKADVAKYRDEVLARTSIPTANKSLKYLRVALGAAWEDEYAQDNPAAKLKVLKRHDDEQLARRPFTLSELKTVMEHATGEWKGLILFGLYTGQRLRDIATLTWQNLDIEKDVLRFVTAKTGRRMEIPLAAPLHAYVETLPSSDDPNAPLFPAAHKLASKETANSQLSQEFHGILVAAGMSKARSKAETGLGNSHRRTVSPISFHSLRHTATSLLKNAGVSESVAMGIIGHDSEAISRHYTKISGDAMRTALAKLPDLTAKGESK
jgi:integrase